MILVDTSVWIDYLRSGDQELVHLLYTTQVLTHPFIVGELACGNLSNRSVFLKLLADLPQIVTATDMEALFFIEQHHLMGRGIGYVDAHLLASAYLGGPTRLWTRDRRLSVLTAELDKIY